MLLDSRDLRNITTAFVCLSMTLAASGMVLYFLRYGWTLDSLIKGHFGDAERVALGWTTWLEIVWPHLLAISTITFGLGHLLAFVDGPKNQLPLALSLVLSGLAHSLSGGLVLLFGSKVVVIKLATFIWFHGALFWVSLRILKSAWASQRKL